MVMVLLTLLTTIIIVTVMTIDVVVVPMEMNMTVVTMEPVTIAIVSMPIITTVAGCHDHSRGRFHGDGIGSNADGDRPHYERHATLARRRSRRAH